MWPLDADSLGFLKARWSQDHQIPYVVAGFKNESQLIKGSSRLGLEQLRLHATQV